MNSSSATGMTPQSGAPRPAEVQRQRSPLGEVVAACELREAKRPGGAGRHHYYRSVLRDLLGNLWECTHRHANKDEAQACSGVELQRRIESGEVKPGRRRP